MGFRVGFVLWLGIASMLGANPFRIVAEMYPPYEYVIDGRVAGPDFEMLERAAQVAGIELRYEFVPWARADAMVRSGAADAIFSIRKSADRETYLSFPETPLGWGETVLVAGPGYTGHPKTLQELLSTPVGTAAANYYGPQFEALPFKRVISPSQDALMRRLADGTLTLVAMNRPVAVHLMKELGLKNLRFLDFKLDRADYYVAFSKASPRGAALARLLGDALRQLETSGELATFRRAYQ